MRVLSRVEAWLSAQRPQWPCWAAVAFGAGIALYFALPQEPPLFLGLAFMAFSLTVALVARRSAWLLLAGLSVAILASGFTIATWRSAALEAPMLSRPLKRAVIEGSVAEIELFPGAQRVTLRDLAIAGLAPSDTPRLVRIRLNKLTEPIDIGDRLRVFADLTPPAPPAAPGGFDFRRQAYFQQLGAVGFSLRAPLILERAGRGSFNERMASLRVAIAERIRAALPGDDGGIAIALIVGYQTALKQRDVDAMRDSGLAHLLSISGLHIGLAAGICFFSLRAILALIPPLALRFPIKKWAAIVAMLGAVFYAGLAGWPVPTLRALVMTGIVFLAILIDRSPISFRLLAWAAILLLLMAPESLVGASFQMSFAAVAGLIALYEAQRDRFAAWRRLGKQSPDALGRVLGWSERRALGLGLLATTSLVASLMTAPFALYHFNRLTLYGIAANMAAVPLTSFLIMPAAIAALLAMPFGLEHWPLQVVGWGCRAILAIAHLVAGWDNAVLFVPAMPRWGLALFAAGLALVALIIGKLRWLGLPLCLAGFFSYLANPAPDLLASGDGRLIAVKGTDDLYRFNARQASRSAAENWMRRIAQKKRLVLAKSDECNEDHCRLNSAAGAIGLAFTDAGLEAACAGSTALLVSLEPLRGRCGGAGARIDRFDVWRNGAYGVWFDANGGMRILSVAEDVGDRPWRLRRFKPSGGPTPRGVDSGQGDPD